MIDPTRITMFNRSVYSLQEFWLFSMIVAGKNAKVAAKATERLVSISHRYSTDIFSGIRLLNRFGQLENALKEARTGQCTRLVKGIMQSTGLNLQTCTVEDLEAIYGVGPKTARFFLVHSRPNQKYAILDTHILAHLRHLGVDAPKTTPTGKKYAELEKLVLELAAVVGMSPADYDLYIWNQRSKNGLKL